MTEQQKMEGWFHIKKQINGEDYYLSPGMRRWVYAKSKKHRFGKFPKEDCMAFLEVKNNDEPETSYQLVPMSKLQSAITALK